MELTEFAKTILFGTDLADKLISPAVLTDKSPKSISHLPELPGRPTKLRLSFDGAHASQSFPSLSTFEDDRKRGIVLHFFANHELLALELMALVLLRFPQAPKSFRRSLAQTMRDEQKHMRLYLENMVDLGVDFGEVAVGGFFWKCLSQMKSPYDFVVQMGLTFEQANLDFALFYQEVFAKIGDSRRAELMETVYLDEVRHVRHGLEWFREWKPSQVSDWDAYTQNLPFPLTAIRAKGNVFSAEARRLVGFDEDYISKLQRFHSSKGRPPRIGFYNAAQELEMGSPNLAFQQGKLLDEMAHDLEAMMLLLLAPDDVMALRRPLSERLKEELAQVGIPVPETVYYSERRRQISWMPRRAHAGLLPWGWSPRVDHLSLGLPMPLGGARPDSDRWRNMASKRGSHQLREAWYGSQRRELSRYACNLQEVEAAVQFFAEESPRFVVVKGLFGSAGRNQVRLEPGAITDQQRHWLQRNIQTFGGVIVEPFRSLVVEFSTQASVHSSGQVVHYGSVRNLSSRQGQFLASCAGKNLFGLGIETRKFLFAEDVLGEFERACQFVGERLFEQGYIGPYGVDHYVFRNCDGRLQTFALSELNLRHTMGRVALAAKARAQAGRSVAFLLVPKSHSALQTEVRLKKSGQVSLVDSGQYLLGDPALAKRVVSMVIVRHEKEIESVLEQYLGSAFRPVVRSSSPHFD